MSIDFGGVPIGSVLPVHFGSYNAAGASVTLTGLAVTDIEIYKGTSVTQRSSDAGYALIDTDGIDIDGVTGQHGFSIDTGDNTDAGFFAAGSFYNVWVSAVTIDSQTVNFLAATFRLTVAESLAGAPKADVYALGGVIQSATDLKDFADDGYDPSTNKVQGVVLVDTLTTYTGNTAQTGDSFARIGVAGAGLTNIDLPNQTMDITGNITGNLSGSVGSVTGLTASNLDATISSRASAANLATVDGIVDDILLDTAEIGAAGAGLTAINLPNQTMDIVGNITGNLSGSVGSVTGLTASDVGAIKAKTDNLPTDPADQSLIIAATNTILADTNAILVDTGTTLDGKIDAIKTQTDKLTFTVANQLDANVQYVNDVEVNGDGSPGTPWGP